MKPRAVENIAIAGLKSVDNSKGFFLQHEAKGLKSTVT